MRQGLETGLASWYKEPMKPTVIDRFFVCKFNEPSTEIPWAGMDNASGGYPYRSGSYPMDTNVHRWHYTLNNRPTVLEHVKKYAGYDTYKPELEVYEVTVIQDDESSTVAVSVEKV